MAKLIDPKDPIERKKQWKRPKLKTDREALRKDRIDSAKGGVQHGNHSL